MRKPLSRSQFICLSLLWIALCYIVVIKTPRLDGPTILMLILSGLLVFIPIYKSLKKK